MPIFERLWNLAKRHRRKFVVAGVVAGGIFVLNHYAKRRLREWQDRETAECVERMRKEQHFKSTQTTCKTTAMGLMPSLQTRVMTLADCESLTDLLRERPPNKLLIWDQLKCESFTRILAAIYGSSLLTTALNVQLSILGGYMYRDAAAISSASAETVTPTANVSIQQRYLALAHHFLGPGCEAMVTGLRLAVHSRMDTVSLKQGLTLRQLQDLIEDTRQQFERSMTSLKDHDDYGDGRDLELMSFLLPSEAEEENFLVGSAGPRDGDQATFRQLMLETRDLFESGECRSVLAVTLDTAFSYLLDQVSALFVLGDDLSEEGGVGDHAPGFVNPNEVTVPLAKLIPTMSALTLSLLGDRAEQLTVRLLSTEEQKILGANVYEAFSQCQNNN